MKKTKILELTGIGLGLGSMFLGLLRDKVDDEQRKEEINICRKNPAMNILSF